MAPSRLWLSATAQAGSRWCFLFLLSLLALLDFLAARLRACWARSMSYFARLFLALPASAIRLSASLIALVIAAGTD